MKNNIFNVDFIKKMSIWEIILFFVFLIAQIVISIVYHNTVVNFVIFITNFLYIVCASYKSFWLFISGTICPFFLAYVCYQNGLYGQVILNLAGFVPLQFIGFFNWMKELKNEKKGNVVKKDEIESRNLSLVGILVTLTIFVVVFLITQFVLSKLDGQVMSYGDAFVTVGSLMGTLLITFRYAENWWVYLVVNIVSVLLWLQLAISGTSDAVSLCVTNFAFLTWTVFGLIK